MSPLGHSPIDRLMDAVDRMRPPAATPLRRQGCWAAACLLLAAAVITLCSKSSPLYPFNDWVDANCYLTIGHGILRGQMPYRDLIDHKGPLLYLLHAPAAALDPAGFFGVYLLEILAAAGFLLAALCLLRLSGGRRMAPALPLLAAGATVTAPRSCVSRFWPGRCTGRCAPSAPEKSRRQRTV